MKLSTIIAVSLAFCVAEVASARPPAQGREPEPEREKQPAIARLEPDADGNGIIDAQEMEAAAEHRIKQAREMLQRIRQKFDTDGDGVLSDAEIAKMRHVMEERGQGKGGLPAFLERIDTDGDFQITAAETAAAKAQMKEQFTRRNEAVLKRFDEDKDGILNEQELAKAKAAGEKRRRRMQERQKEVREQSGRPRKGPRAKQPLDD